MKTSILQKRAVRKIWKSQAGQAVLEKRSCLGKVREPGVDWQVQATENPGREFVRILKSGSLEF